ncbi:MAG: sugar phosphate isomerase/epimerase family protein [Candidatus Bathyarchaeia archaeon]|jgi:sugar phosphate isomerase/epimerase
MLPIDFASRISVSVPLDEVSLRIVSKELELRYIEAIPGEDLDVRSVRSVLDSYGIIAAQMHGPSDRSSDIGNLNRIVRTKAIEKHKRYLKYCVALGVKYYVLHPGGILYGKWDDRQKVPTFQFDRNFVEKLIELNVSSIRELAGEAGEHGVKIAVENGPLNDPTFLTITDHLRIISEVRRDNVGVCIDVGHANVGMKLKPADVLRQVGSLTWALHLHDNDGTGDQHLPPGRGNIDWADVVKALEEIRYEGSLNIEFISSMSKEFEGKDYAQSVKSGIALLRKIISES